ncbi:Homoisocitrate dehydrogenase [compost metagenome]
MLSAIQMLRYLGEKDAAQRFETALFEVFEEGKSITKDLGGNARTNEFARAIEEKIKAGASASA